MGFVILICFGEDARTAGCNLSTQLTERLAGGVNASHWLVASYDNGVWSCQQTGHNEPTTFDTWREVEAAMPWSGDWWKDTSLLLMASCANADEWNANRQVAASICEQLRNIGHLPSDPQRRALVLMPDEFWSEWMSQIEGEKNPGFGGCSLTLLVTDAMAPGAPKPPTWPAGVRKSTEDWILGWSLLAIKDRMQATSFLNHGEFPFGSICVERSSIVDVEHVSDCFVNAGLRDFLNRGPNSEKANTQDISKMFQDSQSPVLKPPAWPNSPEHPLPWTCKAIEHWIADSQLACMQGMRVLSNQWQEKLVSQKREFEIHRREKLRHLVENLAGTESAVLRTSGISGIENLVTCMKGEVKKRKLMPSAIRWLSSKHYSEGRIQEETSLQWEELKKQPASLAFGQLVSESWIWWLIAVILISVGHYVPTWHGWALITAGPIVAAFPVWRFLKRRKTFRERVAATRIQCLSLLNSHFEQAAKDQKQAAHEKNMMDICQVLDRRIPNWEAWSCTVQNRLKSLDSVYPEAPHAFLQAARRSFNQLWENFVQGLGRTDRVTDLFERDLLHPLQDLARHFIWSDWEEGKQKQALKLNTLKNEWSRWPQRNPLLAPVNHGTVKPRPFLLHPYEDDGQASGLPQDERCGLLQGEGLKREFIVFGVNAALGLPAFNAVKQSAKEGGK